MVYEDPSFEPQCLKELSDVGAGEAASAIGRFAGQGHRFAAELQALHARSEAVQELVGKVTEALVEAARILKVQPLEPAKLLELAQSQDHGLFVRPAISCPMIGLAQLATAWQVVEDSGLGGLHQVRHLLRAGLAGHSQGIVSAVALASARSRGELLRATSTAVCILWLIGLHAEAVEGGMALIEGAGLVRKTIDTMVASFSGLYVAGCNMQHSFVLSGTTSALEDFQEQLEAGQLECLTGCKFRKLRIEAPFHSPMLAGIVPAVAADARRLNLSLGPTSLPVFTGSGDRLEERPTVERLVALVCSEEINWVGTMASVGQCAYTVEFGPGAPLPLPSGARLPALVAEAAVADVAAGNGEGAATNAVAKKGPQVQLAQQLALVQLDPQEIRSRVLGVLASALVCEETDIDHETPFFDLGLKSNDLARFAGALSDAFGGAAVAAHELFDYPTVQQLAARLEQQLARRPIEPGGEADIVVASDCPGPEDIKGCVLWVLASALGCDREDVELDIHFELLGLNEDDFGRIAGALTDRIRMQVHVEDFIDFPTANKLAQRLGQRLVGFRNFGPAWALITPARVDPGVVDKLLMQRELSLDVVLQVQRKLSKRLSQNDVQAELKRLAAACFPDGEAYLAALHSRVMDEEEKIYRRLGFQNQDTDVLRKRSLRIAAENIKSSPELRAHSQKLVELTWPSDSDKWYW